MAKTFTVRDVPQATYHTMIWGVCRQPAFGELKTDANRVIHAHTEGKSAYAFAPVTPGRREPYMSVPAWMLDAFFDYGGTT